MKRVRAGRDDAQSVVVRWADVGSSRTALMAVTQAGVDLDALERALIRFALEAHDGNQTRAAAFLGLSRSALIYRMQKHGIGLAAGRTHRSQNPAGAGRCGEESSR
jgi:DNA-binding NtrC family response regulator